MYLLFFCVYMHAIYTGFHCCLFSGNIGSPFLVLLPECSHHYSTVRSAVHPAPCPLCACPSTSTSLDRFFFQMNFFFLTSLHPFQGECFSTCVLQSDFCSVPHKSVFLVLEDSISSFSLIPNIQPRPHSVYLCIVPRLHGA